MRVREPLCRRVTGVENRLPWRGVPRRSLRERLADARSVPASYVEQLEAAPINLEEQLGSDEVHDALEALKDREIVEFGGPLGFDLADCRAAIRVTTASQVDCLLYTSPSPRD